MKYGYAAIRTRDGYVSAIAADTGDVRMDLHGVVSRLMERHYIVREPVDLIRDDLFDFWSLHEMRKPEN